MTYLSNTSDAPSSQSQTLPLPRVSDPRLSATRGVDGASPNHTEMALGDKVVRGETGNFIVPSYTTDQSIRDAPSISTASLPASETVLDNTDLPTALQAVEEQHRPSSPSLRSAEEGQSRNGKVYSRAGGGGGEGTNPDPPHGSTTEFIS